MDLQKIADGETLLTAMDNYSVAHGESLPANVANSFAEVRSYLFNEQNEFLLEFGKEPSCSK